MIKALSDQLSGSSEWSIDNVVWTNLYKVAPQTGNPSGRLMNLQFQCCAKILEHEIRHHNPQNVVFLTGINWAGRFLKEFGVQNELSTPQRFVKFTGSSNGVNYVVGLHPQGKPEQPHCDEIIETLNTFCPSAH
jgi:uracil-DNA glycosylase